MRKQIYCHGHKKMLPRGRFSRRKLARGLQACGVWVRIKVSPGICVERFSKYVGSVKSASPAAGAAAWVVIGKAVPCWKWRRGCFQARARNPVQTRSKRTWMIKIMFFFLFFPEAIYLSPRRKRLCNWISIENLSFLVRPILSHKKIINGKRYL